MVGAGQSLRVNVLASHFNLSNLWMFDDAHARNSGESLRGGVQGQFYQVAQNFS